MNQSNSTVTTATTYSGGTEDHSSSHLHVGVVFGIIIIVIVLIVTPLLFLCKNIEFTCPQKARLFRHRTNGTRKKSRSVVNHGTGEKRKVSSNSRPDFQQVVQEQKLGGQNDSFAQHKSAAPDYECNSNLQRELLPA